MPMKSSNFTGILHTGNIQYILRSLPFNWPIHGTLWVCMLYVIQYRDVVYRVFLYYVATGGKFSACAHSFHQFYVQYMYVSINSYPSMCLLFSLYKIYTYKHVHGICVCLLFFLSFVYVSNGFTTMMTTASLYVTNTYCTVTILVCVSSGFVYICVGLGKSLPQYMWYILNFLCGW